MHPSFRRSVAIIALCSATVMYSPPAFAGPDDGKTVATKGHVDAPKTFWENNNFVLRSERGSKGSELIDDSVIWIGKGWDENEKSKYQFSLPTDHTMDFIGQPGQTFYTAPDLMNGNHEPIWWGFGADSALPVQDFRNEAASLDIISVTGPGEMEVFVYDDTNPHLLRHFLGTSENSPHSSILTAGAHTHNSTLFTKPGRYQVTYRTTARHKNGTLIASPPSTMSIQVGGQEPKAEKTLSTQERFDAAASMELAADDYTFKIAPKEKQEKSGDEHLSTLSFSAKDTSLSGTLTLFIDGYFLTDLPVTNGQASWDEMLGEFDSKIQAVFTPNDQQHGRWISEELSYKYKQTSGTTSATNKTTWTDSSNMQRQVQPTEDIQLSNPGIHARFERVNETVNRLIVEADDPSYIGFIHGGFYSKHNSQYATMNFEGLIRNGRGQFTFNDDDGIYDDDSIQLKIIPHPLMSGGSLDTPIGGRYGNNKTPRYDGMLTIDNTQPNPSPNPKTDITTCNNKPVLDRGHVDIAASMATHSLQTTLHDDTAIVDNKSVDRRLDQVVLGVHDNAIKTQRKDKLKFLDDNYYLLPQTQHNDIIWPGYSTQAIDYSQLDGSVYLTITPASIPSGASWGAFLDASLSGDNQILLDSTTNDHLIEVGLASHAHTNWAFSSAGLYTFKVSYSAKTKAGKRITSAPSTLTFAIGDETLKKCATGNYIPDNKPTPPNPAPPTTEKPKPGGSSMFNLDTFARALFGIVASVGALTTIGAILAKFIPQPLLRSLLGR